MLGTEHRNGGLFQGLLKAMVDRPDLFNSEADRLAAEAELAALIPAAHLDLRVNSLKADRAAVAERLSALAMAQNPSREDFEGALTMYEEALRLAPDTPAILSALSEAYEALDDLPTARYYAEQAQQQAADEPAYDYALAQLYVRTGSPRDAIRVYEAMQEHSPNEIAALEELAQLQSVTGRT